MNIETNYFNFFGNIIELRSPNYYLLKTIKNYLPFFSCEASGKKLQATFYISEEKDACSVTYDKKFFNSNLIIILSPTRIIVCDFYRRPWQVYIRCFGKYTKYCGMTHENYIYFYLFEPILLLVLKRLGLFQLHSSAVEKNGNALIFPAKTSSGKTTLALILAKKGFRLISNDQIFLKEENNKIYALGPKENISVGKGSLKLFPELEFLKRYPSIKKGCAVKKMLSVEEFEKIFGCTASGAKIKLIVFPNLNLTKPTELIPLSKKEALFKLLSQKPKELKSILGQNISFNKQLDIYSKLALQAKAYSLSVGHSPEIIPRLINRCL